MKPKLNFFYLKQLIMKKKLSTILCSLLFLAGITSMAQAQIYVSPSGSNSNDGSKGSPLKNIQSAIDMAKKKKVTDGESIEIRIAEGEYKGKLRVAKWIFEDLGKKSLIVKGGYSSNFEDRDPFTYQTILRADKEHRSPIKVELKDGAALDLDGLVVDGTGLHEYDGDRVISDLRFPIIQLNGAYRGAKFTMQNCTVHNSIGSAVHLNKSWSSTFIIKNNVIGGGERALYVTQNLKEKTKVTFEDNTVFSTLADSPVIVFDGSNAEISINGNLFLNVDGSGPIFKNGNGQHEGVSITNNSFINTSDIYETSVNSKTIVVGLDEIGDTKSTSSGNKKVKSPYSIPGSLKSKLANHEGHNVKMAIDEMKAFLPKKVAPGAKGAPGAQPVNK